MLFFEPQTPLWFEALLKGDTSALTVTLEQAVTDVGAYQSGRSLSDKQVKEIADFLKPFTGKVDAEYTRPPVLPKSTAKTPKADEGN